MSPSGWFGIWVLDDLDVSAFPIDHDQVEHHQADACAGRRSSPGPTWPGAHRGSELDDEVAVPLVHTA